MAIIGAGFDDHSFSSDESYNHLFIDTENTEVKGLYFQRGQLLRGRDTSWFVDPSLRALINVGGIRYAFPWSTLEDFPQSRLSHLHSCSTLREIAEFCDDYDPLCHEFFFDRDPLAFQMIFNFLGRGKLRVLQDVCNVALHTELLYWGIDVGQMAPCCHHRMMCSVDEVVQHQRKEEEWRERRRVMRANAEQGSFFHKLGEAVENPHSGLQAKCLPSSPCQTSSSKNLWYVPTKAMGECSQKCRNMFLVESICVAWFTLEFLVRFFHAQSKLEFIQGPLNITDIAAILPYYVSLFLEFKDETVHDIVAGAGKSTLDKLGLILRVMRALRIMYVMKLARHSMGLQTLGLTMQRSVTDFGLLLLFICVLAPNAARTPQLMFSSIPASYWWSIISVTTVGYGDMVPRSIPGQVGALIIILAGILILSFPSTSIFHTFNRTYNELKEEHKRLWKEERGAELRQRVKDIGTCKTINAIILCKLYFKIFNNPGYPNFCRHVHVFLCTLVAST
uniref:Potassium voltage-gated channel, subfamily G, member 4b n=1 Tax=Maylandia zebra TaxID=106582 RepID=A0A3P9DIG9_9CICH